jgi:hypothetical protein
MGDTTTETTDRLVDDVYTIAGCGGKAHEVRLVCSDALVLDVREG